MKRLLYGKDIFDAAYSYVKDLFLKGLTVSVSVKTKTVSEDHDEDESRTYSETGKETASATLSKTGSESATETATESGSENFTQGGTESVTENTDENITDTHTQTQTQTDNSIEYEITDTQKTVFESVRNSETSGSSERLTESSSEGSGSKSFEESQESGSTGNTETASETSLTKGISKVRNETVRESVEKTLAEDAEIKIRGELEERFPYILASVCNELEVLDGEYRRARGLEAGEAVNEFFIGLDDPFPLSDCFAFPCAMYTSSMFLIDFDGDKSDEFFAKYCDRVSAIRANIPFSSAPTAEKYPYL